MTRRPINSAPHACCSGPAAGQQEIRAIEVDSIGCYRWIVESNALAATLGTDVPYPQRSIRARAENAGAIWAKAHETHPFGVAQERHDFPSGGCLPHPGRCIVTSRDDELAVDTEIDGARVAVVPFESADFGARCCDENIVAFSRDANERTVGAPGRITGTAALGSGAESPGEQSRTVEQQTLIDFGLSRFDAQGLELPDVGIVFHDSPLPCRGRKGLYWAASQKLEMCSLDKATMLHELAHAWANRHLAAEEMEAFVAWRGPQTATHLILTLGLEVDVLIENLTTITGQDPVFRHAGEWSIIDKTPGHSPEFAKLGW